MTENTFDAETYSAPLNLANGEKQPSFTMTGSTQDIGSIITNTHTRRIVWAVYVIAGLTLGGLSAWFTTTEGSVPVWLQGALAVSAFLAAPFGTLAIANIPTKK